MNNTLFLKYREGNINMHINLFPVFIYMRTKRCAKASVTYYTIVAAVKVSMRPHRYLPIPFSSISARFLRETCRSIVKPEFSPRIHVKSRPVDGIFSSHSFALCFFLSPFPSGGNTKGRWRWITIEWTIDSHKETPARERKDQGNMFRETFPELSDVSIFPRERSRSSIA